MHKRWWLCCTRDDTSSTLQIKCIIHCLWTWHFVFLPWRKLHSGQLPTASPCDCVTFLCLHCWPCILKPTFYTYAFMQRGFQLLAIMYRLCSFQRSEGELLSQASVGSARKGFLCFELHPAMWNKEKNIVLLVKKSTLKLELCYVLWYNLLDSLSFSFFFVKYINI